MVSGRESSWDNEVITADPPCPFNGTSRNCAVTKTRTLSWHGGHRAGRVPFNLAEGTDYRLTWDFPTSHWTQTGMLAFATLPARWGDFRFTEIFLDEKVKSALLIRSSRPNRGAFRDRHVRGAGCGGRSGA